jgi:hypothetical protein
MTEQPHQPQQLEVIIIHMAGAVNNGFIWFRIGSYECENISSDSTKYVHFSKS